MQTPAPHDFAGTLPITVIRHPGELHVGDRAAAGELGRRTMGLARAPVASRTPLRGHGTDLSGCGGYAGPGHGRRPSARPIRLRLGPTTTVGRATDHNGAVISGSCNVVAVLDGHLAGMASGVPTAEDGVVELISMWESPTARSRGVGDQLVQAVERWARDMRAGVLRIAVAQGNEMACALYQRNGFSRTGEFGDLMPDGVRREYIMAKTFSASAD